MKLSILIFSSLVYLFTGWSVASSSEDNKYFHYESLNVDYVNQSTYLFPVSNAAPVEYEFKTKINNYNAGSILKSATSYGRSRLSNLTANFKSYIGQVCKNLNTTQLLNSVNLPNATAQKLSATVELTNGKLVDVKSIAPYNECPGFYGDDSYTLETRMLVHECTVTYDCKLTVLWALSTTFKVVALVNDMKVDSKFILNSTNFEITLDYIDIPKGTKIKVDIVNQGTLSYVFNQFLSFVFYFTETSILNNAQSSAKNFIQEKLRELPKLNNTTPEVSQLKCFGFWLFNS